MLFRKAGVDSGTIKLVPDLITYGRAAGSFSQSESLFDEGERRKVGDTLWDQVIDDKKEAKKLMKPWRDVTGESQGAAWARSVLSFLARAAAGRLRSLDRSPVCSLAPWWRAAALPALASWAYSLWYRAASPRALLAVPPPPGLLPPLLAGLKTKTSLRRRCKDCYIVRRRGRLDVYCKTNPRHKQRKL
ncbi:LOW QUALITY PROTEIN: uncharacterized protein LJ264_002171 [Porphyrio hochstetteri]